MSYKGWQNFDAGKHQARVKGIIVCESCGKDAIRTGPVQKFCSTCSAEKDLLRKKVWARDNPAKPNRARNEKRQELIRSNGVTASTEAAKGIDWNADEPLTETWSARVSVPFDYGYSKNSIYRTIGAGHVVLRKETKALRLALMEELKRAVAGRCLEGKVWLDILVQKPNNKGDAVNVVDTVCDAVKVACGVDDRWFSIRRLDWQIVKERGRLFVGVSQEIMEHERACSLCGLVLPLAGNFHKSKSNRLGHGRECKTCTNTLDAHERAERRRVKTDA